MGSSKFVTTRQAAQLLGVTMRTVYRYTTKGILSYKIEDAKGKKLLIDEEDIIKWKKGRREVLANPLQRDIIAKQQAEIQTLKTQMATVMRLLNIRYDALNMTLPEYDTFYRAAEQASVEGWAPHSEEMWADYFVRIKTEDLEKISLATNDPHPWRPFLRLAATMHLNPWNKELTELLAAGRSNVQQVAGIWCVLKEESPRTFDVLQERDAAPLKKLVRRMQKAQS